MPKLLQGIVTVIDVFYQYATEYGNCDMLSKKEMKELLETEFHQILKVRTLYQVLNSEAILFSTSSYLLFIYQIPDRNLLFGNRQLNLAESKSSINHALIMFYNVIRLK